MTDIGARLAYRLLGAGGETVALLRVATACGLALATAACSVSFPMASLVDEETTGAIRAKAASPLSPDLGTEDWRRAKGAMAVALDPHGNGSSVAWDNPDTGIRGSFTPVGQPFVKSDEICRAFLATVVGQTSTSSLQGNGCRPSGGEWAIKTVKPWRKPA